MITFSAIANFVSRIGELKSIRRGVYATVEDEVSSAFQGGACQGTGQWHQNSIMV
jgi:hypothetical protein